MYKHWPDRDTELLEAFDTRDRHRLNEWSIKQGIIWPTCPNRSLCLVHAAILRIPDVEQEIRDECHKYLYGHVTKLTDTPTPGIMFNGDEYIAIPPSLQLY